MHNIIRSAIVELEIIGYVIDAGFFRVFPASS